MTELQKIELNILKEVIKILDKHNLRYFAIGGTCIGAIRHNGFIPWDYDIDIAMPREDYELFKNIYYKEIPEYLNKYDYDNISTYKYIFLKIYDKNFSLIEFDEYKQPRHIYGPYIDIFPIDGIPNDIKTIKKIINKLKILYSININTRPCLFPKHSKIKLLFNYIYNHIFKFIKYNYYTDLICKMLKKYNFDDSNLSIFSWRFAYSHERLIFNQKFFSETIKLKFEDTYIKIPKYYDEYLKQDFSDYLKLPAKELRKSEHKFFIDLNHPTEYYRNLYNEGKLNLNYEKN